MERIDDQLLRLFAFSSFCSHGCCPFSVWFCRRRHTSMRRTLRKAKSRSRFFRTRTIKSGVNSDTNTSQTSSSNCPRSRTPQSAAWSLAGAFKSPTSLCAMHPAHRTVQRCFAVAHNETTLIQPFQKQMYLRITSA